MLGLLLALVAGGVDALGWLTFSLPQSGRHTPRAAWRPLSSSTASAPARSPLPLVVLIAAITIDRRLARLGVAAARPEEG